MKKILISILITISSTILSTAVIYGLRCYLKWEVVPFDEDFRGLTILFALGGVIGGGWYLFTGSKK